MIFTIILVRSSSCEKESHRLNLQHQASLSPIMPPIHTTAAPATVAPDPMDVSSLPPAPAVSKTTRLIAGLLVDVYGLAELSGSQSSVQAAAGQQPQGLPKVTRVSVLWLHHARGRQRQDMADIAARAIGAWQEVRRQAITTAQATGETGRDVKKASRGLIAVAFDQRNHGTRAVSEQVAAAAAASDTDGKGQAAVNEYSAATQARVTNAAWRSGNPWHAQDMFGVVAGCVVDTSLLMDALEGYVDLGHPNAVDHHLVLGVSLGGHSAWQTLFAEERIRGGVVVIGCPDLMRACSRIPLAICYLFHFIHLILPVPFVIYYLSISYTSCSRFLSSYLTVPSHTPRVPGPFRQILPFHFI